LARKPISEKTVAANVLKYGTGAINVDGCRIATDEPLGRLNNSVSTFNHKNTTPLVNNSGDKGRWPANVTFDEEAAEVLDSQSGMLKSGWTNADKRTGMLRGNHAPNANNGEHYSDSGGASRFFYVAKPSTKERNAGLEGMPEKVAGSYGNFAGDGRGRQTEHTPRANTHPTVKPVALMRYLCRLITPPNGFILDPFTGSGTTGCAAVLEGFNFVGIEQDAEHVATAEARIAHWASTVAEEAA